jgi:hypothetical protein
VEAECKKSRDQVDPVEGANTGVFGAAPGNLCGAVTDWWSNEDSNQGPARFAARVGIGVVIGDLVGSDAPQEQAILWINLSNQTNLLDLQSSISLAC